MKRTVDADPRPGRFLLTGSVRAELQSPGWPATGCVVHVPFTTITVREQIGHVDAEPVIERVARSGADELRTPPSSIDVRDYMMCASRPHVYHLRTAGGRQKVDLIVELSGDRVIGIEIKAAAAVGAADARHLAWLRDALGPRFVHGLVLHAGPGLFPIADRITAAPIATLWR